MPRTPRSREEIEILINTAGKVFRDDEAGTVLALQAIALCLLDIRDAVTEGRAERDNSDYVALFNPKKEDPTNSDK